MCRRVTCSRCGKPSFSGCGAHVEQVLGDVPHAQRCKCNERAASTPTNSTSSASSWWPFGKKEGDK